MSVSAPTPILPDSAQTLLDQLYTPLLVIDEKDCISHHNVAAANLLGVTAARLHNAPLALVANMPVAIPNLIERSRRTQRRHIARDITIQTRAGPRRLDIVASVLEHGVLLEMPAIDPLRGQRDTVARWQQTEALELMVQGLFHEIRNPLSGMRGAAQLLEEEISGSLQGAELTEYTRLIQQEVDRVSLLVDQFCRQAQQPALLAVNIHQILSDVVKLQSAAWDDSPKITEDYDPSIPEVMAESPLLTQIFLNLLNNAAQADAQIIQVRTRIKHQCPLPEGDVRTAVTISVTDDGSGVPRHLRDILFLPMVSGRPDGTGLGLALAQQIARRHGGLLQYLEQADGSCFQLILPIADAAV